MTKKLFNALSFAGFICLMMVIIVSFVDPKFEWYAPATFGLVLGIGFGIWADILRIKSKLNV